MWSADQKKGLGIVAVGHVLYLASLYLGDGAAPLLAARAVGAIAGLAMVGGSALYVRGKGYSPLWGLGGFLPFVGIGTLVLIPAFPVEVKSPEDRDETVSKHGEDSGETLPR